jgi:hypothetical protein
MMGRSVEQSAKGKVRMGMMVVVVGGPKTATDDPGSTLAVFRAAPQPVASPQPNKFTCGPDSVQNLGMVRKSVFVLKIASNQLCMRDFFDRMLQFQIY